MGKPPGGCFLFAEGTSSVGFARCKPATHPGPRSARTYCRSDTVPARLTLARVYLPARSQLARLVLRPVG